MVVVAITMAGADAVTIAMSWRGHGGAGHRCCRRRRGGDGVLVLARRRRRRRGRLSASIVDEVPSKVDVAAPASPRRGRGFEVLGVDDPRARPSRRSRLGFVEMRMSR